MTSGTHALILAQSAFEAVCKERDEALALLASEKSTRNAIIAKGTKGETMSTELRPTPETNAEENKHGNGNAMHAHCHDSSHLSGDFADFARKLERERDSAKTLNRLLLDQLEAQATLLEAVRHERDNTWEKLEAMREAIKDAHYALDYVYNHGEGSCAFPYRTDDDLCSENRFHHVKDALDALAAFPNIKP